MTRKNTNRTNATAIDKRHGGWDIRIPGSDHPS